MMLRDIGLQYGPIVIILSLTEAYSVTNRTNLFGTINATPFHLVYSYAEKYTVFPDCVLKYPSSLCGFSHSPSNATSYSLFSLSMIVSLPGFKSPRTFQVPIRWFWRIEYFTIHLRICIFSISCTTGVFGPGYLWAPGISRFARHHICIKYSGKFKRGGFLLPSTLGYLEVISSPLGLRTILATRCIG